MVECISHEDENVIKVELRATAEGVVMMGVGKRVENRKGVKFISYL